MRRASVHRGTSIAPRASRYNSLRQPVDRVLLTVSDDVAVNSKQNPHIAVP